MQLDGVTMQHILKNIIFPNKLIYKPLKLVAMENLNEWQTICKLYNEKDGCFAELKELKYRIDLSYSEYKIESAYKIVTEKGEEFTIQEAVSNNTAKIDGIGNKWILTE